MLKRNVLKNGIANRRGTNGIIRNASEKTSHVTVKSSGRQRFDVTFKLSIPGVKVLAHHNSKDAKIPELCGAVPAGF